MIPSRPWPRLIMGLTVLAALTVVLAVWLRARHQADALLRMDPDRILADPRMLAYANSIARPQYLRHCAACHGSAFQGSVSLGVPDLAHGTWLYGRDPVDVEHTILYGIRSGHPKARNVTDMPALVRTGQISPADAWDAVDYLQSLAGQPRDGAAALRGRLIYYDKGNCYDCHANDARGVSDYGAPPLIGPSYLYGGDRQTLYQSILNGRHGISPAWVDVLSAAQIRALALYLVSAPPARAAKN